MTLRRLIALLTLAILAVWASAAQAQGTFPAPPPGQKEAGLAGNPVVPPVSNASSGPIHGAVRPEQFPPAMAASSEQCAKEFAPLREDAEQRGKLIKDAGERHAAPDEACRLIKNFAQAEVRMLDYVESNAARCWIPSRIAVQLRDGHKKTEGLQTRVCNIAQQMQRRGLPRGYDDRMVLPVGDFPPYYGR